MVLESEIRTVKESVLNQELRQLLKNNLKCERCGSLFDSNTGLKRNLDTHPKTRTEVCPTCGKAFYTKSTLLQHIRIHTEYPRPYPCDQCDYKAVNRYILRNHIDTHTEGKYPCHVCDFVSKTYVALRSHVLKTHREGEQEQYYCDKCNRQLKSKSNLENHLKHSRCHRTTDFYNCSFCQKQFKDQAHLKRHIKLHNDSDSKPFKCPRCVLSFRENYNLQKHISGVHEKGELFKCNQCDKVYKYRNSLSDHIDMAHNTDKTKPLFNCKQCHKSFFHAKVLRTHQLRVHVEAEKECPLCCRMFKQKSKLNRHLREVHKEAIIKPTTSWHFVRGKK